LGKTRQKQSKDRHREILEAAARVITDRGLAETRISDIAERCGVSPGLILYYFESKDRLLVEALTWANDNFYLTQSRELRRMQSAREQLDHLITMSVPGCFGLRPARRVGAVGGDLGARAPRPAMAKEREVLERRWRQSIADIVRHGRSTGEFPENGVDADELGLRIGAFIDGLAIEVLMNDTNVPPERMLEACREVAATLIGFVLDAEATTA
jgi:AcrR family transcriptional regulator